MFFLLVRFENRFTMLSSADLGAVDTLYYSQTLFCRSIVFLLSNLQAFRFGCFDQLIDMYQRSNSLGQVWLKFFQQQNRNLFWRYFSNYVVCPLRPAFHCSFFSLLQCFPNIVFFSWLLWLFQQRHLTNNATVLERDTGQGVA